MILYNSLLSEQGRGSGLQILAITRSADIVITILDTIRPNLHHELLISEWDTIANRNNLPCVYIYKEADRISPEEIYLLALYPRSIIISCNLILTGDYVSKILWDYLQLIRIYIKKPGAHYFGQGLILRRGVTVLEVCYSIHISLVLKFRYALVWGTSTKYSPQKVGFNHILHDGDVIRVFKRWDHHTAN